MLLTSCKQFPKISFAYHADKCPCNTVKVTFELAAPLQLL